MPRYFQPVTSLLIPHWNHRQQLLLMAKRYVVYAVTRDAPPAPEKEVRASSMEEDLKKPKDHAALRGAPTGP